MRIQLKWMGEPWFAWFGRGMDEFYNRSIHGVLFGVYFVYFYERKMVPDYYWYLGGVEFDQEVWYNNYQEGVCVTMPEDIEDLEYHAGKGGLRRPLHPNTMRALINSGIAKEMSVND